MASAPVRPPAAVAQCSPRAVARGALASAPEADVERLVHSVPGDAPPADRPVATPHKAATPEADVRSVRFPREARLLDGRSFTRVFGGSRRFADKHWTVLVHDAPPGQAARLGLAIAKKRARRAVDRNRIKRVARESFRHRRAALGARDVVIMNRDAATAADTARLRASLDALWDKVLRVGSGTARP